MHARPLHSNLQIAKENGYIPEVEFDNAGFPKDLNWEEGDIPKDLLTQNRRRAMIVNHEAGPQNEAIIAAARAQIEANRQKEKLKQQSNKQITSTLDRFVTKCLPDAKLRGELRLLARASVGMADGCRLPRTGKKRTQPINAGRRVSVLLANTQHAVCLLVLRLWKPTPQPAPPTRLTN